jgi:hypothetical protein
MRPFPPTPRDSPRSSSGPALGGNQVARPELIIISSTTAPIHICRPDRVLILRNGQPGEQGRAGHGAGQRTHAPEDDVRHDQDRAGRRKSGLKKPIWLPKNTPARPDVTRRWRTRQLDAER